MVNWEAEDIKQFKAEARASQQEYCDLLGDREYDAVDKWEWNVLRRKVGFGMYGPPGSTPSDENRNTGYNKEQLEVIEKVCDKLVENLNFSSQSIHFACIFVVMKVFDKRYTVPVFKAKRHDESSSQCIFVDTGARKYSSWIDYLGNNTLEKCIYCYPTRGLYETVNNNEVCVKFGTSPACDFVSRVFSIFDSVSTVVAVAATGVGVAALCAVPIAGPIMAGTAVAGISTSAYGVGRSSYALVDRASHSQSISLTDRDARSCWLSIVGSSLGFAQGRMIASMTNAARAGEVMGKAGRIAFIIVQTGTLTVNGIGIVHGLAVLIDKTERNELTPLDVFQFSASLLFFGNAAMNFKTASTIIKEVQHDVINSHREPLSKDAKKLFNKQTGKLRGPDEMHGNAKVVKQLNRIENSKDLYEMMSDKNNVASHKVKLTPDGFKGLLDVNKNLKIHPLKLLEIPLETRQAIYDSTKEYASGLVSKDQFHLDMKTYCRDHQIAFESMRQDTMKKLCQLYGADKPNNIVVGGRKIFANATPHEIDRLRVVLENTMANNETILEVATEFAITRGCTTTKDFILFAEYLVADLTETMKSYETNYQNELTKAKMQDGFNQAKFDEGWGIGRGVKRNKFHREKALNQFKTTEGYTELNNRFDDLKSKVGPLNQKCEPGFFSDNAATYHYLKHKHFSSGEITPEQYFQIAEEVVGNPVNRTNTMLSQDGSCVMVTFIEPERGVKAIKIDRCDGSGIATVMYDEKFLKRD